MVVRRAGGRVIRRSGARPAARRSGGLRTITKSGRCGTRGGVWSSVEDRRIRPGWRARGADGPGARSRRMDRAGSGRPHETAARRTDRGAARPPMYSADGAPWSEGRFRHPAGPSARSTSKRPTTRQESPPCATPDIRKPAPRGAFSDIGTPSEELGAGAGHGSSQPGAAHHDPGHSGPTGHHRGGPSPAVRRDVGRETARRGGAPSWSSSEKRRFRGRGRTSASKGWRWTSSGRTHGSWWRWTGGPPMTPPPRSRPIGGATAAGFRVVRVTWRQLTDEPGAVLVRLAQALVRPGARPG